MKNVFAYVRVSTQKQGTQGSSLQEQRASISAYAERYNLSIAQWFEEMETAAKRGRPQFRQMIQGLDIQIGNRVPFILYLDEFHNFTTLMFANMMGELRKYGVGLVLAHQYIQQLKPDIRHAVLGNAATLISFRVGPEDAGILAWEFQPKFDVEDLLNLPNHGTYLKIMIEGAPSQPFSAQTLNYADRPELKAATVLPNTAPPQGPDSDYL
jgi:hypothetical protein